MGYSRGNYDLLRCLIILLYGTFGYGEVVCHKCVTDSPEPCLTETCKGDMCTMSATNQWWHSGLRQEVQNKYFRGCISGSLLNKNIPDHCESYEEGEKGSITNCFCSGDNYCNNNNEFERQQIMFYTCACDDCKGDENKCRGEYCSVIRFDKKEKRGCLNSSTSLFERRADGAIVQPPLLGLADLKSNSPREIMDTESFLCSHDMCNEDGIPEEREHSRTMECPLSYRVTTNIEALNKKEEEDVCLGEYCWSSKVTNRKLRDLFQEYSASGCLTLAGKTRIAEELNDDGCLNVETEDLDMEFCIKAPPPTPSPPPPVMEETTTVREEEELPATTRKVPRRKQKTKKPEKVVKETEAEKEQESNNTTIVVVFVLIMVMIVIAGVFWKFQLHKKIFRARYETVAG